MIKMYLSSSRMFEVQQCDFHPRKNRNPLISSRRSWTETRYLTTPNRRIACRSAKATKKCLCMLINLRANRIYLRDCSVAISRWNILSIVSCAIVCDGWMLRDKRQNYANINSMGIECEADLGLGEATLEFD